MKRKNVLILLATVYMLGSMNPMTVLNVNAQEAKRVQAVEMSVVSGNDAVIENNLAAMEEIAVTEEIVAEEIVAEEQAPDILQSDEETFVESGFVYIVNEEGNAIITDFIGSVEGGFTAPVTLGGYNVTEIGEGAFRDNKDITWLVIPENITTIHNYAFYGCTNLKAIQLSKGLKELGQSAFGECDDLESVEIPKSLEKVYTYGMTTSYGAFYGCDSLKTITFEEGTTQICAHLFRNCPGIESINIPETIYMIEEGAFANCANFQTVQMSDNVNSIGKDAFYGCTKLTGIELSKGLTEIGNAAFGECDALTSVEIPKKLEKVLIYGLTSNYGVFNGCNNLKEVTFEEGITQICANLFHNCPGIENIEIPDTVTTIGERAFQNCTGLQAITVPEQVLSLGNYVFADCTGLTNVSMGSGIMTLPNNAFSNCTALQKVVLPYRMTTVNKNAFSGCTQLTEIVIPRKTSNIGRDVFSNPTALTIYGVSGTYAEEYAATIGATFVNTEVEAATLSLPATEMTLDVEDTALLLTSFTPADFTNEVIFSSDNTDVATISDLGVITAVGVGSTQIRVSAGNVSAACTLTVNYGFQCADIQKDSWKYVPAKYVYSLGIMTGKGNTDEGKIVFAPDESLTREQLAQILYSAENKPAMTYSARFTDVPDGQWYTSAVLWAAEKGIVSGYPEGDYGVGDSITREQLAAMLYKYAEYKGYNIYARADLEAYTDAADISSWATNQLSWAVANKIMSGKGDGLDPKGAATRAECATMIRAFMVKFAE